MDLNDQDVLANETFQAILDRVGEENMATNKFSRSIHMAPATLRILNESSFKPHVVSIGPLHRKDENLQQFEVRKAAFVHQLLSRPEPPLTQMLNACVQKVTSVIENIRLCYVDLTGYGDTELAIMMVMDACFILEFIHCLQANEYSGTSLMLQDEYIPYDLLLLENQIPFFVLENIYECVIYTFGENIPLAVFIRPLLKFGNLFKRKIKLGVGSSYTKHDHILGFLHHCYKPKHYIQSGLPRSTVHSVVELDTAGVNFMPNRGAEWPMAMEVRYSRYRFTPTLTLPILYLNIFTELLFRNLIAYEQSYVVSPDVNPYVTSYAMTMDMLINTHEDISKLVTSGVIVNHLGSNEEAANMINSIGKDVVRQRFYYVEQWISLDRHCKRYFPRKIMKTYYELKHTYFRSPWSVIGLLTGFALLVLTLIQTIFTVKSS